VIADNLHLRLPGILRDADIDPEALRGLLRLAIDHPERWSPDNLQSTLSRYGPRTAIVFNFTESQVFDDHEGADNMYR
jgi:hypothetical protein